MIKKTDWNVNVSNVSVSFKERLFTSRDLTEADLRLSISDVPDYLEINDIELAVFEITTAIKNKKRIIIIGDYDVDGIMATFELLKFFGIIGYNVSYYIPDRLTEGYGISDAVADKIINSKKFDLVITVDNGIAAIDQIKRIVDAGIRVVVTDHHECKEILPPAHAVLDCKRPDNTYPFRELCGAGIALKLIWALSDEFGLHEDTWMQFIMYAAIATIADVMPLVNENRIIVKYGLEMIRKTNNIAILNLLRVAEKLDNKANLQVDDIAFYIAPLINAASRVGSVNVAMNLFMTTSEAHAIYYADELKTLNELRKKIESEILAEANEFLMKNYNFKSVNPIIVYGNNWHGGVIGIVASRLVDAYSKPAIVLSKNEDGLYHGSCRNFGNISIIDILNAAGEHTLQYGGHEGAAGLTLTEEQLPKFVEAVNKYAQKNFTINMFKPVITADILMTLDEITLDNFYYLDTLAPFGQGNPYPVFVVKDARIKALKKIGQKEGAENAHMKLVVAKADEKIPKKVTEGIGFYNSEFVDLLMPEDVVDIMFKPNINTFQGISTPQMQILDIHCDIYQKEGVSTEENTLYLEDEVPVTELAEEYMLNINEYVPTEEECFNAYKAISYLIARQSNRILITDLDILSLIISSKMGDEYISPFKTARMIEILTEAGYFKYKYMSNSKIIISATDCQNVKRINDTTVYQTLQEEKEYAYD